MNYTKGEVAFVIRNSLYFKKNAKVEITELVTYGGWYHVKPLNARLLTEEGLDIFNKEGYIRVSDEIISKRYDRLKWL